MAYADKKVAYKVINEYQKEKYDRITIIRPKGEREQLKAIAIEKGYRSVNDFINTCIDEKLKQFKIALDKEESCSEAKKNGENI